jgi:two-component system phosphate regulon sensor histidine kinase PhoR
VSAVAVVLLVLAAAILLVLMFLMWRLLQTAGKVEVAAGSVAAGHFDTRIGPIASPAGRMPAAFDHMAEQVEAQMTAASQERSRLTAALNSSIDAVLAVDGEARVVFANTACERVFQRPSASIVGNPFVWLLANEQVMDAIHASRDTGARRLEFIDRPAGRQQYLQITTSPIEGGGDWAVLVVCHDLTEVRRTEQMRRDFVANVSHELRTPLAALKSVVETLMGGAADDPTVERDFLARADSEVDRMIQLVEELLELSRMESGVPLTLAPTDIERLLSETVERLRPQAERKHLSLRLEAGALVGIVSVDALRIERAVINLVQNAIKFTPEGGSIFVAAERRPDGFEISVRDTGIGIAPEVLPRIFERFFKVDQSRSDLGSGLGLAIVRHTAEAHGGSVDVESEHGRGSRFSFFIPI